MTPEPADRGQGAEVVPLRAADAGTEARLDEATGPAYVTIDDGRAQRKPIIPLHWRSRERRETARHAAGGTARPRRGLPRGPAARSTRR